MDTVDPHSEEAFLAAERGDVDVLRRLVKARKFNPSRTNDQGCTVLYLLANAGNIEVRCQAQTKRSHGCSCGTESAADKAQQDKGFCCRSFYLRASKSSSPPSLLTSLFSMQSAYRA